MTNEEDVRKTVALMRELGVTELAGNGYHIILGPAPDEPTDLAQIKKHREELERRNEEHRRNIATAAASRIGPVNGVGSRR